MPPELLRPGDAVVWQDVPESELVLLHSTSGRYYGLNATGGWIWRTLALRPRTTAELVEGMVAEFAVDREQAAADLEPLLVALRGADLITSRPAVPAG